MICDFSGIPSKGAANKKKYGVSFEEATTVFYDEYGVQFSDDEHSEWEDRFLLLGLSSRLKLLIACHCYREDDAVIRLISARPATKNEAQDYRR